MKIHRRETKSRRNGRPVYVWDLRWSEKRRDANGAPIREHGRYVWASRSETFRSEEAANNRRRELEAQTAATGRTIGRAVLEQPFATFASAWVSEAADDVRTGALKERTARDRRDVLRRYVSPVFGPRPVVSITRADVVAFRSDLIAKGLAPATVKGVMAALRNVLELAVEGRALAENPAVLRRSRKRNATATAEGFEHRPLSEQQVAAVTAHAEKDHAVWALVVVFLAYTGVRAAELAGLDVGDLRLTAHPDGSTSGSVAVRRTRKLVEREWRTDTPKSAKSTRRVPIADWLAEDLAAYLRDVHPYGDDPDAPLFPGRKVGGYSHGKNRKAPDAPLAGAPQWRTSEDEWKPIEPSVFYRSVLKPALEAAGLPVSSPGTKGVRLHDLRHTFATIMLNNGVDYREVSEWMGHESYAFMLKTYAHWIPTDDRASANRVRRPMAPPSPSASGELAREKGANRPSSDNVIPIRAAQ